MKSRPYPLLMWLVNQVRNSVGAAQFRQARERQGQPAWWVYVTLTPFLYLVGVAGLVRFVYKGWWAQVAFMVAWLLLLTVLSRPARKAWQDHQHGRRSR